MKTTPGCRRLLLALWLGLLLCPLPGLAEQRFSFDIAPMQADLALKALSDQSGYPVIFRSAEVDAVRTHPVVGRFTLAEALELMLGGTPLEGVLSEGEVVTVVARSGEACGDQAQGCGEAGQETGLLAAMIAFFSPGSTPVGAAGGGREGPLEEVIVTAQKREQGLRDVPISVSVLSNELIGTTGISTVAALIPMVQGLAGNTVGLSQNTWGIRGISTNDYSIGSEPAVAVFIDDAYIGRGLFSIPAFHDLERIEIIRGPQGTLLGRNASIGAISMVSNKPDAHNSLAIGLAVGNEGQRRYQLVGNLAVDDAFAMRLAYRGSRLEGIWEDIVNDEQVYFDSDAIRLAARWTPSENFEAQLKYEASETKTNHAAVINIPLNVAEPGVEYADRYGLTRPNRDVLDNVGVGLRLTWNISDTLALVSISDVRSGDQVSFWDVDGTADDAAVDEIFGPFTGGLTLSLYDEPSADTYYQEFRLDGQAGPVDWLVGASYFQEDISTAFDLHVIDTALGLGLLARDQFANRGDNEAFGIYGDATWRLNDRLVITGGTRWTRDRKGWCTETMAAQLGVIEGPTDGELCSEQSWNEWTPRLAVHYDIGVGTMLFASVARGYKAGGYNPTAIDTDGDGVSETIVSFDPETNIAYEAGLKSAGMDGRWRVNASMFFNDYQDLQYSDLTLNGALIFNAGAAESKGLELEAAYVPLDGLTLSANFAYTDAKLSSGPYAGSRLAFAPEYTWSLAANYAMRFSSGTLSWFAMYNYTDDYDFTILADTPDYQQEGYGLLNARLTYSPLRGNWDVAIAGENLIDERYAVSRGDIGTGPAILQAPTRLYRAEVNFRF